MCMCEKDHQASQHALLVPSLCLLMTSSMLLLLPLSLSLSLPLPLSLSLSLSLLLGTTALLILARGLGGLRVLLVNVGGKHVSPEGQGLGALNHLLVHILGLLLKRHSILYNNTSRRKGEKREGRKKKKERHISR